VERFVNGTVEESEGIAHTIVDRTRARQATEKPDRHRPVITPADRDCRRGGG
jgi:hypothetical protein